MGGVLKAAKSIRIIGVVIAVIAIAGALFGIGSFSAFVDRAADPIHAAIVGLPDEMVDIFIFGMAAGVGITSYILLAYVKDEK